MNLSDYDIFIMNIRLLNYNSNDINNKLLKNPFSKSNNTLMCNIIHFLLLSYDNNLNETLRLCYPVVTLSDFKLFKDTVYPLLEQILPPSILPYRSILDLAKGDKLIHFFREFSDFVVQSKLKSPYKHYQDDSLLNNNSLLLNMKKNALITHITRIKEEIIAKSKNILNIQNKWKQYATKLEQQIQSLEKDNALLKNKVVNINKKNGEKFTEIASIDRAPKIENHKEVIKMLSNLHNTFIMNDEFKNNVNYIDVNTNLYDSITPQTFGITNEDDNNITVLHEQTNTLYNRVNEDNKRFNSGQENNNENENNIKALLTQLNKQMNDIYKQLINIKNAI